MDFPRTNLGHIDTGKNIRDRVCPNCKSLNFMETVSLEKCIDCGLECDYWGSGPNEVYKQMMERKWEEEERNQMLDDEQTFY